MTNTDKKQKFFQSLMALKTILYLWRMTWFRVLLFPFSLIYGLVVQIRNKLFDWNILTSRKFSVPVIGIGNLSTGGTGKTPHVEYLIQLLADKRHIAVLSRGYKRKTKGFLVADREPSAIEVGDEVAQIKNKFPDIVVAVHEKRRVGIARILHEYPKTDLIILDDSFQHRYVKPGLNLLLTEYYNPFFRNLLLPSGNLREPKSGIKRADAVIVTKTPDVFSPLDRRFYLEKLQPHTNKDIFFSGLQYATLVPLWETSNTVRSVKIKTIFLLTGIANPEALEEYLKNHCDDLFTYSFPDHYNYTTEDLKPLREDYQANISQSKAIITTEKDAMRLKPSAIKDFFSGIPVYYLPIRVRFHKHDKKKFDALIHSFLNQENQ